jgi:hypothetical protein
LRLPVGIDSLQPRLVSQRPRVLKAERVLVSFYRFLERMGDGTGNSSAKVQKTNVWRIYQALDLSNEKQIARYDNGVGTPSNRYLALAGGTFGWGLKRNVLDIHMFVFAIWFANFVSRFDVSLRL